MAMNESRKALLFACLAMAVLVMFFYGIISVPSYQAEIDQEAKSDACQSAFGENSTWVTETDGGQVICTADGDVSITDYNDPEFKIGEWLEYAVTFGGSHGD